MGGLVEFLSGIKRGVFYQSTFIYKGFPIDGMFDFTGGYGSKLGTLKIGWLIRSIDQNMPEDPGSSNLNAKSRKVAFSLGQTLLGKPCFGWFTIIFSHGRRDICPHARKKQCAPGHPQRINHGCWAKGRFRVGGAGARVYPIYKSLVFQTILVEINDHQRSKRGFILKV